MKPDDKYPPDRPPVTLASTLTKAREFYVENPTGGNLHIVLDDGNTSSYWVRWCVELALLRGDKPCLELALDLLELTEAQRDSVYEKL